MMHTAVCGIKTWRTLAKYNSQMHPPVVKRQKLKISTKYSPYKGKNYNKSHILIALTGISYIVT